MIRYKIEKTGSYKDFSYCIILHMTGYRCGYVIISDAVADKLRSKLFTPDVIECHGGITFNKNISENDKLTPPGWWIGFDCAHSGDSPDLEAVTEAFGDNTHVFMPRDIYGQLWTMKEVEDECCQIIRQIEEFLKQN